MKRRDFIDLDSGEAPAVVQTDVCIIGSGAAGTYLAAELGRYGIDTVLLEAGGSSTVSGELTGLDPLFGRDIYPGALVGRFFGLGGSTSHWGGAMVPHTSHDLRTGDRHEEAWETIVKRVSIHARTVLSRLGFHSDPDFAGFPRQLHPRTCDALERAGIEAHANLILPVSRKNFSGLWRDDFGRRRKKFFLNASAKTWNLQTEQHGRFMVNGLEAVSRSGSRIAVSAHRYVIAAGAIESARILLEMDRTSGNCLFDDDAMPGRGFADHISLPIAVVDQMDWGRVQNLFGPRFVGGWMRSFRFLLRPEYPDQPRGFGHFIFEQESVGFKLAKEVLSALQARRIPNVPLGELILGAKGLAAITYERFFKSRLYVPSGTPVRLQLDIEQRPSARNCLTLSDEMDSYGRPRLKIDWSISDDDIEATAAMASRLLSAWSADGSSLPRLLANPVTEGGVKPYDAYHPTRTCPMGSQENAVVDLDLKVCRLTNVWVVSTGVLPNPGSANPTFSMLCLAQELADHLGRNR